MLEDGYLVERNIRSEVVLQAVDVDKLTVDLFVLVQLHEEVLPLLLVLLHAPLQAVKLGCGRVDSDLCFPFYI